VSNHIAAHRMIVRGEPLEAIAGEAGFGSEWVRVLP